MSNEIVSNLHQSGSRNQDNFGLDGDDASNPSQTSASAKRMARISEVLDRSVIEPSATVDVDLEQLEMPNVHAYDADQLERGLQNQVTEAIERLQPSNARNAILPTVLESNRRVNIGELTPYEQFIADQARLESRAGTKLKKTNDKTNKKPAVVNPLVKEKLRGLRKAKSKRTVEKRLSPQLRTKRRGADEMGKRGSLSDLQNSTNNDDDAGSANASDDDFAPSSASSSSEDDNLDDEEEENDEKAESKMVGRSTRGKARGRQAGGRFVRDDGNEEHFQERIKKLKAERLIEFAIDKSMHRLKNGSVVAQHVWDRLYKYQKTGVRWLYELHAQYCGGILADEMGLGKTIQICAFLRSLSESRKRSKIFSCYEGLGPCLIVCPATLMHQWVRELNEWFPLCRVSVLHASGSHAGTPRQLIERMHTDTQHGRVLITSYSTYVRQCKELLKVDWHYAILDEGHKIRNPDAKVTLRMKELRTPHRLILTGSPMQNNLKELWSLIDFVYPGLLGFIKDFVEKFAIPITQGGYANADSVQVRTAYKCACMLRDAIAPYMLRRMKKDVEALVNLPEKSEQILFCDITPEQRHLYEQYLESTECGRILRDRMDAFVGLITLRKLCNHPDLVNGGPNRHDIIDTATDPDAEFGAACRSGKMLVLRSLLRLWHQQHQKVLLFSQSRQMLTIIEKFVVLEGYSYLRMDGTTPIGRRQELVSRFNTNPDLFVFLLTTRVGGLGVNLTGANRVVIYDPDWNPSVDSQARERAWRIGQTRAVTVYRLMTSGTIEEKIYQRQIFKYFLASKVLVDPKQQRFFKTNDLHELFTLGAAHRADRPQDAGTETAAIFAGTSAELNRHNFFYEHDKTVGGETERAKASKVANASKPTTDKEANVEVKPKTAYNKEVEAEEEAMYGEEIEVSLSEAKIQKLREIAKRMAARKFEVNVAPKLVEAMAEQTADKKRKSNKRLFEGKHEIPYLNRQTNMHSAAADAPTSSKAQDDYVLRSLLKNTGVHSALGHDAIVETVNSPDVQLVEDEAAVVAKRAAGLLKRARRAHNDFLQYARQQPVVPVKRPSPLRDPSIPITDEELIMVLLKRKEQHLEPIELRDDAGPPIAFGDRFEELAAEVRDFFAVHDGRASTADILAKFKGRVQPSDSFAFRAILRRLCDLLPNSQWMLKHDYA